MQMTNLFITYDLISPGKNYDAVRRRIKQLGQSHQLQHSLFYVHTELSMADAYIFVATALKANERLAVIDVQSGVVTNWAHPPIEACNAIWVVPKNISPDHQESYSL